VPRGRGKGRGRVLEGVMGGGRVEEHAVANRCTNEGKGNHTHRLTAAGDTHRQTHA